MSSPALLDNNPLVMDELPQTPGRRRLSARSWEIVWNIQMQSPLHNPDTLQGFVRQYNTDQVVFRTKLRTAQRLMVVVTLEDMDDEISTRMLFDLLRGLERQYGPIQTIENRPIELWPLRQASFG
ncbi:hypothetical protein ACFOSD_12675 [Salinispirillum marinum]|uniref:Uncharacterized protein n=2 Tax=Saccharospirillaceae TaxID=255527 RepID=A0ABV8BIC5_9GAMM